MSATETSNPYARWRRLGAAWTLGLCASVAGAVVLAQEAAGPALLPVARRPIAAGDQPEHVFAARPWNALGQASLAAWRGRPLLVEFWGPRCGPCVGTAVPATLRLKETFGDDLGLLFVESQGFGRDGGLAFALGQRWLGGGAMWTDEAPFEAPSRTLPACVLVGNDGRVLLAGNPITLHKEIERQIAEQIKLRNRPPSGTPPELCFAWTEFARERHARAVDALSEAVADHPSDDGLRAAATAAEASFHAALEARCARVASWIADGAYEAAAEEIDVLARGVKGWSAFESRVAALRAELEDPARAADREAMRVLDRLCARYFDSAGDPERAADLLRFAEERPGTRAAARAREVASWARSKR